MLLLGRVAAEAPPLETLAELFDSIWHALGNLVLYIVGLQDEIVSSESGTAMLHVIQNVLWPMTVGSLPAVAVVWAIFYFPLRRLVEKYQERRRRRSRERGGASSGDMPNIAP